MPAWSGDKINPAELNNGNEWDLDSQVAIEELNAMVNGGIYAQNFAEALADTPNNTNANNVGTASVELVDNIKGGKTYKKFKFNNLKGQTGATGDTGTSYRAMGAWSSATAYVNNADYIDTVQFMGSTYYAKINNTNQSPADGVENAYWGVLALKGSDSSVTIVQTTGTSTTAVMSQNAVTLALDNKVDKEAGKGLSEENFTTTLKDKLDGIQSGLTLSDNLDSPSSAVGLSTKGADDLLQKKITFFISDFTTVPVGEENAVTFYQGSEGENVTGRRYDFVTHNAVVTDVTGRILNSGSFYIRLNETVAGLRLPWVHIPIGNNNSIYIRFIVQEDNNSIKMYASKSIVNGLSIICASYVDV